jgi:hypothetical protein
MVTLTCESGLPSQVLSLLASHVFPTMALSYLGKLKALCPYSLARLTFDPQNTWSMGLPVKGLHNLWICTLFHWVFFCQSKLGSHDSFVYGDISRQFGETISSFVLSDIAQKTCLNCVENNHWISSLVFWIISQLKVDIHSVWLVLLWVI